jgi:hypothetical protein
VRLKQNIFTVIVLLFIASSLLWGCEKPADRRLEDSRQEVRVAEIKFIAEWQTFKRESEETIAANEKLINALKQRIDASGPAHKVMYNRETVALELRNQNLMIRLTEYEEGGQSNLKEFKIIFNKGLYDVEEKMKDLFVSID